MEMMQNYEISPNASALQIKNVQGKIGSYAISTVDFDTCFVQNSAKSNARLRKQRGTKEVIHKLFSDCARIITDPFWIEKFNLAATGRFPPKFHYNDGLLIFKKNTKSQSIEVSRNPSEAAYSCMEFFRLHGGIFSPLDEKISNELQTARAQEKKEILTWSSAGKKLQECLLSDYISQMKDHMKLTYLEVEKFKQTIMLGIINKYFGKNNIIIDKNRIVSIEGLFWNETTRIFYIDPNLKPTGARPSNRNKDGHESVDPNQKDTVPQFTVKWEKYVDSLDKKFVKHERAIRRIIISTQSSTIKNLQMVTTTATTATSATTMTSTDNNSTTDDYDE